MELTVSAILSAAADRAGKASPVAAQDAGVWLFSEAIPAGVIGQAEAGLVMRGISLAQGKAIPGNLVSELVDDAAEFIGGGHPARDASS